MGCLGGDLRRRLALSPEAELARIFPRLPSVNRTSDVDWYYNCHAWAMHRTDVWWDPIDPSTPALPPWLRIYFPPGLPRDDYSLTNFQAGYARQGYAGCQDGTLEPNVEKIALYMLGSRVTHTARQLADGRWTSKCGKDIDIWHQTPAELGGPHPAYGVVAAYMAKPVP